MKHVETAITKRLESAGAWPKDFFTLLCKVSKGPSDDEGSFTEKKASVTTRGHYDGSSVDQGTVETRWLPITKTSRNLIKHDISVEVFHPTKRDKSFDNTDQVVEHVALIHGFVVKAAKLAGIKVVKTSKDFLPLAKAGKPVAIVIPHPKHGFEILLSEAADPLTWKK